MGVALAALGVVVAAYELVAVATRRVPTITAVVMATPLTARLMVVGTVVAAVIDHFLLGWVL